MRLPDELELPCGTVVRYEYDPGEEQWFDARQGVGSPGYPPEFSVTEIRAGSEWKSPEDFYPADLAAIEAKAAQVFSDWQATQNAMADEAEYQAWKEAHEFRHYEV